MQRGNESRRAKPWNRGGKVRDKRTRCLIEATAGAALSSDLGLQAIQSVLLVFGTSTATRSKREGVKVMSAVIASRVPGCTGSPENRHCTSSCAKCGHLHLTSSIFAGRACKLSLSYYFMSLLHLFPLFFFSLHYSKDGWKVYKRGSLPACRRGYYLKR